ncbi:MAG: FxsA family protein [Solirubrobacterales bacterium]
MPLLLLFIFFVVIPVFELWLILQVAEFFGGGATGAALTVGLLVADSLLGAWLMRTQGRSVWRQFSEALEAGRMPAREIVDGGLVIVGGVLLLTPGFLSDALGVAMLLPPTRKLLGGWVFGFLARRVRLVAAFADTGLQDFARSTQPPRSDRQSEGRARTDSNGSKGAAELAPGDEPDFDFETNR